MGKRIHTIPDPDDYWFSPGFTKFIEDFAVTFAYAFRYYITGLIIGYLFCVTFKKFYTSWSYDERCSRPLVQDDSNKRYRFLDENKQEGKDGNRKSKRNKASDCVKSQASSRNFNRDGQQSQNYWKQCFDNFGFVVVDTMNPSTPFRNNDTEESNTTPITFRWQASQDSTRDELIFNKSNKSSSTTDIQSDNKASKYTQSKINNIKSQDSCVDTHDLTDPNELNRHIPKLKNKRLDTSGLKKIEMETSAAPKNDLVLPNKLSATDLRNAVESSLIPGKKVSKNAVIVLRLRDQHLSACDVFDEEGNSISSGKISGSRKKIKRPTHYRINRKRNEREASKPTRNTENVESSDEVSSEDLNIDKKPRTILSPNKTNNSSNLQYPLGKKSYILSDEKYKRRIQNKKRIKQNSNMWGGMNSQSHIPHSSNLIRQNKTDTKSSTQEEKRSCFKHKKPFKKRYKYLDPSTKPDIKSLGRFFSELRKSNSPTNKQSIPPLWTKQDESNDEEVYQIEVKNLDNALKIRSKSKCTFSENPTIESRINKYNSKDKILTDELRSSRSKHVMSKTSYYSDYSDSDEPIQEEFTGVDKKYRGSTVSIGISNKKGKSPSDGKSKEVVVTNYSDISAGSESASSFEANSTLSQEDKPATGKIDKLIVSVGEECNKNSRSQFWKIFGSKNSGK